MSEFQAVCQIAQEWKHQMPPWAGEQPLIPRNLAEITQRAIDIYMLSKKPNGEMGGIGWWQTANGYTAIALHDHWAGTNRNYQAIADIVKQCERNHPGLINEFNDDTMWWAMLCLHLYSIDDDEWFLDKARAVWQHIQNKHSVCGRGELKFRDADMEGGCYWKTTPGCDQMNSISTGLYAELSVRLALLEKKGGGGDDSKSDKHPHFRKLETLLGHGRPSVDMDQYVEAARCSLGWILRCRYRPRDGVVLDGFLTKRDHANDWTFTYTTGVAIGVCALLYEATRQEEYMILACHMAHRGMRNSKWVEENGVLTERGAYGKGTHDPIKDNDSVGFKAVLIRHLGTLYEVIRRTGVSVTEAQRTAGLVKTFVNINFESQQQRNTNGNGQYGPWWNGPFETPTSHSQMAVLDVMAAVMLVNQK